MKIPINSWRIADLALTCAAGSFSMCCACQRVWPQEERNVVFSTCCSLLPQLTTMQSLPAPCQACLYRVHWPEHS